MRNFSQLSAERLLKIDAPEILFSNSSIEAKAEYRYLARTWHPDSRRSPDTTRVFAHVAELYERARIEILNGQWSEPSDKIEDLLAHVRKLHLSDGTIKTCKYRVMHPFELGRMYICDHSIAYEVDRDHVEFFENARKRIHLLGFKHDEMRQELSQYLPQIKQIYKTNGSNILVVRKTPDQLLLSDIHSYFHNRVEPVQHIGWIINNLLNIACYLEWAGLTHNAIALSTLTISPLRHNAMLLGGWWYATKIGDRLTAVPDRTIGSIPPDVLRTKRADNRIDLDLIKSIARELLGDESGTTLLSDKRIPPILLEWLLLPSAGAAVEEYKLFKREILPQAFGEPKFLNMPLEADQLYKEM